jgi:RNA polymerase sigma-70 factor (ECF subfamily)
LYRRHAGSLLIYLQRYLGETADAEDILQETFVRIFEGRGRYKGRGNFRAWLYTIATRLAADRVKQKLRRATLLSEKLAPIAPQVTREDPLKRVHESQMLEHIRIVLADLPPDYAAAFHLRVREGFSYREMVAISQSPAGTLRSRVHHAIQRIRDALAPLEAASDIGAPSERASAPTHAQIRLAGEGKTSPSARDRKPSSPRSRPARSRGESSNEPEASD